LCFMRTSLPLTRDAMEYIRGTGIRKTVVASDLPHLLLF
jgi:hypothetical protein